MNKIEAVIFDWAGTTVDYGCFAPVYAFQEAFAEAGIDVTMDEVRGPMGMLKKDHIRTMLNMERIRGVWKETYGREPEEKDVDAIYARFEPKLFEILSRFTTPKPHVLETVEQLRSRGIKIGSTTGYTDEMMKVVTAGAREQGYEPDVFYSPDSVEHMGRPYPYMIFKNMQALKVTSVNAVVKVGDTVSDILEGVNAGVMTVGVLEGSSVLGLSEEEFLALSPEERESALEAGRKKFLEAGADSVITNMSELYNLIFQ